MRAPANRILFLAIRWSIQELHHPTYFARCLISGRQRPSRQVRATGLADVARPTCERRPIFVETGRIPFL